MTSREYLFSLEQLGIKLGLAQIRALVDDLGRPDQAYRSIVVAGTNGKGSVTAMVERALRADGYRTGRYVSPHLTRVEERVAIDGRPIAPEEFDALADRIREAAARLPAPPSFFEAVTALAAEAFRRARVDVAAFEVGLGGRLDATNVLSPVGVAIAAVDFDHEQYLGTTIEAIAREKAGIAKPGRVCVLGANPPAVREVVEAACAQVEAGFVFAPDGVDLQASVVDGRTHVRIRTRSHDYGVLTLGLRGRHQIDNAVTAVRLLEELSERGRLRVSSEGIRAGLTDVQWPARLEVREVNGGQVLIDGAHNPSGARALATYVSETYGRRVPVVIGVMRDKNIPQIVAALAPRASALICTAASSPRAASPVELAEIARQVTDVPVSVAADGSSAVRAALSIDTVAVVAGSLYLAGEVRELS